MVSALAFPRRVWRRQRIKIFIVDVVKNLKGFFDDGDEALLGNWRPLMVGQAAFVGAVEALATNDGCRVHEIGGRVG